MSETFQYSAPLRKGVCDLNNISFTNEFLDWKKSVCNGRCEILSVRKMYFEFEEDKALYLLTWIEDLPPERDAAYYYAPYVPLTMTKVNVNQHLKIAKNISSTLKPLDFE